MRAAAVAGNDEGVTTARLFQVDAFASVPFAGNSAAVLVLEGEPDDEFGSAIGTELNQPATAVVWPAGEPGRFGLRWFTAHGELDLCGHGTLAAARVLLDDGHAVGDRIRFDTRYGPLEAVDAGEFVQLRFPSLAPEPLADDGLAEAVRALLPVPVTEMLRNDLDVMAVLDSPVAVRDLEPDLGALRELPVRGADRHRRARGPRRGGRYRRGRHGRLRVPFLPGGDRGGGRRDGIRALRAGTVLDRAAGPPAADRPAAVRARRADPGGAGRGRGAAGRRGA